MSEPEIVEKYHHFQQLSNGVKQAILRPPIPKYAQASEILQHYLNEALRKQRSPEEAMKAAATETRRLLSKH